jgi:hypothetical protein
LPLPKLDPKDRCDLLIDHIKVAVSAQVSIPKEGTNDSSVAYQTAPYSQLFP